MTLSCFLLSFMILAPALSDKVHLLKKLGGLKLKDVGNIELHLAQMEDLISCHSVRHLLNI